MDLKQFAKSIPSTVKRTDRITMTFDPKVGKKLRDYCRKNDLAMSRLVEALVKEALK